LLVASCDLAAAIAVSLCSSGVSSAAAPPGYIVADVGAYGGEPSIVSDNAGQLYETTRSGGTISYTSTNQGTTWRQVTTAACPNDTATS
jgi:hypothetical protein